MEGTKLVTFVTEHCGEVSYTPHDIAFPLTDNCSIDFSETKEAMLSSDDFRLVSVKRWGTIELELPCWLSPSEFARNPVVWKWVFGLGAQKSWPEHWLRFIASGLRGAAKKLAVIKLLATQRFRSSYRQSLAEHLLSWLETPKDSRKYDSPFSQKQWRSLLNAHVTREASQIDAALYRDKSCSL